MLLFVFICNILVIQYPQVKAAVSGAEIVSLDYISPIDSGTTWKLVTKVKNNNLGLVGANLFLYIDFYDESWNALGHHEGSNYIYKLTSGSFTTEEEAGGSLLPVGTNHIWVGLYWDDPDLGKFQDSEPWFDVIVQLPKPSVPSLSSPSDGAELYSSSVDFSWNSVSGATKYEIEIQTSSGSAVLSPTEVSTTSYSKSSLSAGGYRWRVLAKNSAGSSSWSVWRYFTIVFAPSAPSLSSPSDSAELSSSTVDFSWNSVSGATKYEIEIQTSGGSGILSPTEVTDTSYSQSSLSAGGYRWRVKAKNSAGSSDWSGWRYFTIVFPPSVPSLSSPSDGAELYSSSVDFSWNSVSGATKYEIEIQTSSGSAVLSPTEVSTTSYSKSSLSAGGYRWRVLAKNSAGSSSWSVWRYFTIVIVPAPLIVSAIPSASEITLGEWVTITVEATNDGGTADWQGITISFPDNPPTSNIEVVSDTGFDLGSNVYGPGDSVGYGYGAGTRALTYPLAEASANSWGGGVSKSFSVRVKPESAGTFTFYVKTVASVNEDYSYHDPSSGTKDQQDEYVKVYTVNVEQVPAPSITGRVVPSEATVGEWVTLSVTATNEGGSATEQGISFAFPDLSSTSGIEVVDSTSFNVGPHWRDPGDTVNSNYATSTVVVSYPLIEAWSAPWAGGESRTFTIRVRPESAGTFRVFVKSIAAVGDDYGYSDPSSGTPDQQNEYRTEYTMNVVEATKTSTSISVTLPPEVIEQNVIFTGKLIRNDNLEGISDELIRLYDKGDLISDNLLDSVFTQEDGTFVFSWEAKAYNLKSYVELFFIFDGNIYLEETRFPTLEYYYVKVDPVIIPFDYEFIADSMSKVFI